MKDEHQSIVLRGNRALNRLFKGENDVIEAVFLKKDLDKNPRKLKALIKDIARFIAYGEYHDTAEAYTHFFSGNAKFVSAAKRIKKDKTVRDNIAIQDRRFVFGNLIWYPYTMDSWIVE